MATYDAIAKEYQECKLQPWRVHIEQFVLFDLLGDLKGKRVIDLACGEGIYSRKLKRAGAAEVVGVDISAEMIKLGRAAEKQEPLGVEYIVEDVARLNLPGSFDIVLASFLFNYARSREELLALAKPACACLKPGGWLVGVNNYQDQAVEAYGDSRKYGFIKTLRGERREGTPVVWTIFLDDTSFDIENYYLSTPTHEEVMRTAGFSSLEWHQPRVSPAGLQEFGADYWKEFLANPPVIFLECRK